jgi:signal transduction histidine kinase
MSRESAGLRVSLHSPDYRAAVRIEINHRLKWPSWLRFTRMLLPLILLAGTCGANESASRIAQTAPFPDGNSRSALLGSFFALDLEGAKGNTAALLVCLLAVVAFGAIGVLIANSRQGRPAQTRRSGLPFVRAPFVSFWRAEEDERKRVSRELHDSVGQILTGVGLQLRALRSTSLPPDQLRARLEETCRLNAEALRLVRDLAMSLRPALLDDVSLIAALEWQARQLSRQAGIPFSLEASGNLEELPETHRTCIYRCVQEALTNCAKHSQATSIRITVYASAGSVNVTIEDDGIGFKLEKTSGKGLGLLGMRERVAEVNGKLSVVSRQHGGTALSLEIPVPGSVTA